MSAKNKVNALRWAALNEVCLETKQNPPKVLHEKFRSKRIIG